MMLPKEIAVKGQVYTLVRAIGLIDEHGAEGICCDKEKLIKIDITLKGERLKRCLLHEIGHAIQYETGIAQALSIEMQEIITENFSNGIIDLFHVRFK